MTPQLRGIEASPVKNGGVDLLDSPHMPASASLREDQRQFDRAVRVRLLGGLFFDECAYDSPRETRLMFARGMFDESGTHNAAPIGGDGGWVIDPRVDSGPSIAPGVPCSKRTKSRKPATKRKTWTARSHQARIRRVMNAPA